jgi:4-amino-4-deoxy-L-arabinose transferase-like glycosyltransferase
VAESCEEAPDALRGSYPVMLEARLPEVRSTGAAWGWAERAGQLRPEVWLTPLLLFYVAWTVVNPDLGGAGDEGNYLAYAERLTHGDYASEERPDGYLWKGPGLPLMLVPFVALDAPVELARIVLALLLGGAVLLFHRLLRLRLSERASLLGALALGLYLPFLRTLGYVRSEPVAVFLVVLAMYLWARRSDAGGNRYLVGAGLALGALTLTRLEYGYVLTACLLIAGAVWLKGRGRTARDAAAVCAVALALCVPWLAYTYALTDKPFYWSNAGSLSLYWMSGPTPDDLGDWHTVNAVFRRDELAAHRPLFRRLRTMHPVDADEALTKAARENISDHPARFARNLVYNFSRLLFNFPYSLQQETAKALLYVVPNLLLLAGLGVGLVGLARERRWWALVVPPAMFGLLGFAIHLPVAGYPRLWYPVVPIALWLAVLGMSARSERSDTALT